MERLSLWDWLLIVAGWHPSWSMRVIRLIRNLFGASLKGLALTRQAVRATMIRLAAASFAFPPRIEQTDVRIST